MTGFSLIIRGRHPQLLVVGDDAWQVMLIEHGSNRIVILNGEFERSPEQEIDRLCSVLRQHVDVVAGTRTALSLLSNDFRSRRSVDTLIQLDGAPDQPGSPGFVSMARPIAVRAGAVELQLRPLPGSGLVQSSSEPASWIADVRVGRLTAVLAPSLEVIADHGKVDSTLAIAPSGDIGSTLRFLPGLAIATNAQIANRFVSSQANGEADAPPSHLVRIFPRDICAFRFRNGRIVLPDWSQAIGPARR